MAAGPTYYTIPTYSPTRIGGKKIAKFEAEVDIITKRIVAVSIEAVGFTNLGKADWATIISNNEELALLLNAVKDGLVRIWLDDVETGVRSVLTSADWITEIADEFADSNSYIITGTYYESPKFRGVDLKQTATILLGDDNAARWASNYVTSITEFTKPVLNSEDTFYTVKTDFGLDVIIDSSSRNLLLGIELS